MKPWRRYDIAQSKVRHYMVVVFIAIIAFGAGLVVSPYLSTLAPAASPEVITVTTTASASSSQVMTTIQSTSVSATSASSALAAKWLGSDQNVVLWSQAANYARQTATVEGTVVSTYVSSKGTVFLDFHDPYQGYFDVVIFSSDTANFNFSLASFYLNKEVRVTGQIQMYNGAPEIIVHTPSQIEVAYVGFNYP